MHNPAVAIIGAGASGLMAAVVASRVRPHSVCLLEKEARVGRKLLATGNGRCNLLNMQCAPVRYYGSGASVAESLLRTWTPARLKDAFAQLGLTCREERDGRVYPFSGQASSVLDVLRAACERNGVATRVGNGVTKIVRDKNGFSLALARGETVHAGSVIVAAGGKAAPTFGADGGACALLNALGHPIEEPFPALAPLKLPVDAVRGLKGVRTPVRLTLYVDDNAVRQEEGEGLFTDYGLSGVAAMQLARETNVALRGHRPVTLSIGLCDLEMAQAEMTRRVSLFAYEPLETVFTGLLHSRLRLSLLRAAGLSPQAPVTPECEAPLARLLSDWRLPVLGTLPFVHAQITAGGAKLSAFDPETLASQLVPGLYACGEALDVDGDCGGYNLMWAWASAITAGEAAAAYQPGGSA